MAFLYKENMNGGTQPATRQVIIDNDDTITVGDAVLGINGNLEVGASGSGALLGIVQDIVDKNGDSIFGSIAKVGSATVTNATTPGAGKGTVTVAGNNETVDLIAAKVIVDQNAIFSATVVGTVGTTVNSDKIGAYLNLTNESAVNETSATRSLGDKRVLYGWGEDPDDTSRLLVSINASEVFSLVDALS